MTDKPPLEVNISGTALGTSACILNFHRTVIDGYKEPIQDAKMVYGVAVHKYIDIMFKSGGHIPSARAEAIRVFDVPKNDSNKSLHLSDRNHMLTTCFGVWELYIKKDTDFELIQLMQNCWKCKGSGQDFLNMPVVCPICKGQKQFMQPATEVTFSIPYYRDDTIVVNLCGTLDRIGKIKNGCYAIPDWKTTSSWDTRSYFKTYELSRQLRIYVIALKLMAVKYPDSILGKIGKTNIGTFIDAIFIKPAANDNKYLRSDVQQYTDEQLAEFQLTLDDQCRRLSSAIKTGYLPKEGIVNGSCESRWGKCKFWNVCNASKQEVADVLLKRDFIQKPFSPLHYND
jgi:hypothetical protein